MCTYTIGFAKLCHTNYVLHILQEVGADRGKSIGTPHVYLNTNDKIRHNIGI